MEDEVHSPRIVMSKDGRGEVMIWSIALGVAVGAVTYVFTRGVTNRTLEVVNELLEETAEVKIKPRKN